MTSQPQTPSLPSLDDTFGAYLLGTYGSTALFGVTCLQAFMYYRSYPYDRPWIKVLVAILLILEVLHVALNITGSYWFLVTNYFKPEHLLKVTWSATASLVDLLFTALIVHGFYAYRIYTMSGGVWWPALTVIILAFGRAGNFFALCIITFKIEYFSKLAPSLKYGPPTLAFSVATDIFIATTLTWHLHKGRSGIKETNSVVKKLMIIAINNCVLTCVVDIMVLIFITIRPDSLIYLGIFILEGNLYTNSLLATLNARKLFSKELSRRNQDPSTLKMTAPKSSEGIGHLAQFGGPRAGGVHSAVVFAPVRQEGSVSTMTELQLATQSEAAISDNQYKKAVVMDESRRVDL